MTVDNSGYMAADKSDYSLAADNPDYIQTVVDSDYIQTAAPDYNRTVDSLDYMMTAVAVDSGPYSGLPDHTNCCCPFSSLCSFLPP